MRSLPVGALVAAPAVAWASFNRGGFDIILTPLLLVALYLWAMLLLGGLLVGAFRHALLAWIGAGVTGVLAVLLVVLWDGQSIFAPRPLLPSAMTALATMLLVPLGVGLPVLQHLWSRDGRKRLAPAGCLGAWLLAILLVPLAWEAWTDREVARIVEGVKRVQPGQVASHLQAARERGARGPLAPWHWNEDAELKWTALLLGRLAFVTSPTPLAPADADAIDQLVRRCTGTPCGEGVDALEGKLLADRWRATEVAQRPAFAAGLSESQATRFLEHFALQYPESLCVQDAATQRAMRTVISKDRTLRGEQLTNRLRERCPKP